MSINFISPDLLVEAQEQGLKALGYDIDVEAFCADMTKNFNRPSARRYMNRNYAGVIPTDLAVCTTSHEDERQLMEKYGLPHIPNVLAAAVAMGIDSRHDVVLVVYEKFIDKKPLISHELVHYRQIRRGDLTLSLSGDIEWRKPGEECSFNAIESMMKRQALAYDEEELFYQELLKPWEVEAYALTTPPEIVAKVPARCQELIAQYLAANEVSA